MGFIKYVIGEARTKKSEDAQQGDGTGRVKKRGQTPRCAVTKDMKATVHRGTCICGIPVAPGGARPSHTHVCQIPRCGKTWN